jgi:hypothetical protein
MADDTLKSCVLMLADADELLGERARLAELAVPDDPVVKGAEK